MTTVNMLEAKTNLSRLVELIADGQEQEIIIARNGKPAARIVPLKKNASGVRLGIAKGCFTVPASIDENNEAVAHLFSGEDDL